MKLRELLTAVDSVEQLPSYPMEDVEVRGL